MTDIAASLGIHQLRKVDRFQTRRRELANRYDRELSGLPLILPSPGPESDMHAWHLYIVRLTDDAPLSRDEFIEEMASLGIGTSVHFIPLHLQPYWSETYGLRPETFPCATDAFRRAVSLPIYTRMSDQDHTRVIAAVRKILGLRRMPVVITPKLNAVRDGERALHSSATCQSGGTDCID
jgi:dTDP-4-amino-4,6-dideoxygalactose transaminase